MKTCEYFCIQDDKQLQLAHSIHNENDKNAKTKFMISCKIT